MPVRDAKYDKAVYKNRYFIEHSIRISSAKQREKNIFDMAHRLGLAIDGKRKN